jgi:2-amino-4-hydroxy-6-hydroxymethyldihydropteridine diphosphokinase
VDHIRRVVVGLGSNVGDRLSNIQEAVGRLSGDEHIHVTERSPLYETAPVGGVEQGHFLNGAVLLLTALEASELMRRLLEIETGLGRVRGVKNGPRTIDLDILWIEGESVNEPDLVVPHPRLLERSFMLRPLADLASDAADAETGALFADLELAKAELKRVE